MSESVIVVNEFLRIYNGGDGIYIETFKKGFPPEQLPTILIQHPEIGVTSLSVLRSAISQAPRKPEKFGEIKERISVEISENDTIATIVFNLSGDELHTSAREKLAAEVYSLLSLKNIVYGIKKSVLSGVLASGKPYVIAEGMAPVDGNDSVIRMYELQDTKPEVREDDRVDYYEMKLINRVKTGDWLGERLEATGGIPGQTVKGNMIKPVKGKTYPLNYDKNSVQEIYNNGKTTLYARINGAVNYSSGRISVSDHLEITGDVGVSTGNIKFDGYITIKGTICDGFSVEATKDIEINSSLGLGSIKGLTSTGGSIFVKGGISSKGRVEIKAAKNIYIKFADNVNITCGEIVHIGYYCLNSEIKGREVVFDASNGQIIGGHVKAEVKVTVPIIGSEAERKTIVEVTGFNRQLLLENMDGIFRKLGELKSEQQKLKLVLSSFNTNVQMGDFQRRESGDANDRLFSIRDEIKRLEDERKNTSEYLKTRGEGEISATKKIYPNSTIMLKNNIVEINEQMPAATFFTQDCELKRL